MKTMIAAVAMGWGLVLMAEPALAQCTTNTIFTPDGRTVVCQVCCYGGNCTTTCM